MKRSTAAGLVAVLLGILVACGSTQDVSAGADCATGYCDQSPGAANFGDAAASDGEAGATAKTCPIARCEPGHDTCANSTFACDIDLTSDEENCGACGVRCPSPLFQVQGVGRCIDGHCGFRCLPGLVDCDGIPDNGCETKTTTIENCGGCGIKCGPFETCQDGVCKGCSPGMTLCNGECVDLNYSDTNCGACGIRCYDLQPPDHWFAPFTYFGCVGGTCHDKCENRQGDCNNDISDGCEVNLDTPNDDHCGKCGIKCNAPDKCRYDQFNNLICGCDNLPNCTSNPDLFAFCTDLTSDPTNCGACGVICPGGECIDGICSVVCQAKTADCNGSADDGCEKNLASDPENCGACGHVCDAVAGQPCVDGHCAVEECGGPK